MSFLQSGLFYVLILSSNQKRKVMQTFRWDNGVMISRIISAANKFGIFGKYLISAEDNAIIADENALRHFIYKGHTIVVVESLDEYLDKHIYLEQPGESHTDEGIINLKTLDMEKGRSALKEEIFLQLKQFSYQLGLVVKDFDNFIQQQVKTHDS
ncbi:uncharacterized protein [Drosophila takahashii]|uniref:uncharacterized protein n=1 Tax=Drosophila takahashii TaxID=29030 RepID=UPI0038994499